MPKLARELGALAVSRLTKPGLHFVGGVPGLALQVTPTGARSWTLRAVIGGKRRDMGLGAYSPGGVTLAKARESAAAARELIRKGIDPIQQQQAAQSALRAAMVDALTFKESAELYMKAHAAGWKNTKHRQQWRNTLTQHAYPVFGELLVRDVKLVSGQSTAPLRRAVTGGQRWLCAMAAGARSLQPSWLWVTEPAAL